MEKSNIKSLIFGLVAGIAGGVITTIGAILGLTTTDAIWPASAIGAVMGALVHDTKQSITDMIDNRLGTLKNRVEKIRRDVGDVHGLVRLGPYTQDLPLPMGGGWALTGDSAALLAREVLARKPETILELGSGVSTLILGQILKRNGRGRLLSVDHDPEWANQTRRFVEFLGLGDVVTVVDAPLKEIAAGSQAANWYDIPKSSLDTLGAIDILLVDGPPQAQDNPQAARYPAFPCATRPPVGACANIRGRCQPQDRVENGRAVANRRLGMAVAVVRHRRWRLHPYQKTIIGIMRT